MTNNTQEIKEIIRDLLTSLTLEKAALNTLIELQRGIKQNTDLLSSPHEDGEDTIDSLISAALGHKEGLLDMENTLEYLRLYADYSGCSDWE